MSGAILAPGLVDKAINLSLPSIEAILSTQELLWGPDWVAIIIDCPGLNPSIPLVYLLGEKKAWDPEWNDGVELDFEKIARSKLRTTTRTGLSTREVKHLAPWLYESGEYRYFGSAVYEGICVGVSGPRSEADQAIAEIVLATIKMLAYLEDKHRDETGDTQI